MAESTPVQAQFLIYQTEDGSTRVEVRFGGDTAWLSLGQRVELFQRDKSVISRHIKNVFEEGELVRASVVAESATTAADGKTYQVEYFNLDLIISVGYRVKSHRGTQFRIWATQRLREYIVKGFTLDDERLKRGGGGNYFDELLARIRDIRSSEKVFWKKVLEIYATSIDYEARAEASKSFFATLQNKMHWAAHGHTAAEVIANRADAEQPNVGLTTWAGAGPRKGDIGVAKNYLGPDETEVLNRIVTAYLEFAELQALNRKPMYMADWTTKLDDFLKLSDRELLSHADTVSHDDALAKAEHEYERFAAARLQLPTAVEAQFHHRGEPGRAAGGRAAGAGGEIDDAVREVKRLDRARKKPEVMPPVRYHEGKFPPVAIDWPTLIPLIGPEAAAVARYDGVLAAVPNPSVLLSPLTTQEAVLSSRIEGTQATMGEVLAFEAGTVLESADRKDDIDEVLNHRKAMREAAAVELVSGPVALSRIAQPACSQAFNCEGQSGIGDLPVPL